MSQFSVFVKVAGPTISDYMGFNTSVWCFHTVFTSCTKLHRNNFLGSENWVHEKWKYSKVMFSLYVLSNMLCSRQTHNFLKVSRDNALYRSERFYILHTDIVEICFLLQQVRFYFMSLQKHVSVLTLKTCVFFRDLVKIKKSHFSSTERWTIGTKVAKTNSTLNFSSICCIHRSL